MAFSKLFSAKHKLETTICINSNFQKLSIEGSTNRLFIRSYLDVDFNDCLTLYSDKEVTKYFDHGEPRNKTEIFEYIQERGGRYFDCGQPYGLFSVFLKGSGEFIGQVDLVPTEIPGEVEIGWILHTAFQNKGYCSEAVLEFLMPVVDEIRKKEFKTHNLVVNRVIATAHPENISSNKIILKAGLSLYQFQLRYGGNPRNWYCLNLI
jgi:[ribosomal protein S5]-alanine N-acetyltransferase